MKTGNSLLSDNVLRSLCRKQRTKITSKIIILFDFFIFIPIKQLTKKFPFVFPLNTNLIISISRNCFSLSVRPLRSSFIMQKDIKTNYFLFIRQTVFSSPSSPFVMIDGYHSHNYSRASYRSKRHLVNLISVSLAFSFTRNQFI